MSKKEGGYQSSTSKQKQNLHKILRGRYMIRRVKADHLLDFPPLIRREIEHEYAPDGDYSSGIFIRGYRQHLEVSKWPKHALQQMLLQMQLTCHSALALRDNTDPDEPKHLCTEQWWAVLDQLQKPGNFKASVRFEALSKHIQVYIKQKEPWTLHQRHGRCSRCRYNRLLNTFEQFNGECTYCIHYRPLLSPTSLMHWSQQCF